jgi:hypothetical protein
MASATAVGSAVRPAVKAGLRRLWRDNETLQLGLNPRRALVLTGLPSQMCRLLDHLDGSLDVRGIRAAAAELGIDVETTDRFLDSLTAAGVLEDATEVPKLTPEQRRRFAPELASLSLVSSDGGASELTRRQAATVCVVGSGMVASSVRTLLGDAGVGQVLISRSVLPADVVVLVSSGPIDVRVRDDLVRRGTPHLFAGVQELTGLVGPLVLPGRSSCLRCQDLHRSARDPCWPLLAAQFAARPRGFVDPCDTALAAIVAGYATWQVLAHLGGAGVPPTVNGALEITPPDWQVRRRSWLRHPSCGCSW